MKQFFKFMFASFLGTLLTLILVSLFFIGMILGFVALAESQEVEIEPNTVLHIKWTSPITDRGSENPFESFDFSTMESNKPIGLNII